jgi:NADH-quinone oxidoreductase subunit C/D
MPQDHVRDVLRYLKQEASAPYRTLYDLWAIDERGRMNRPGQPGNDFTVVYHLLPYDRNADIRLKVPLYGEYPALPSIVDLWPSANWYECEAWDMFGITFNESARFAL